LKIYLASSWRNQLAVELMTRKLEQMGHVGLSNGRTLWTLARTRNQMSGRFETNIARKAYHDVTSMISAADLIVYLGPGDADVWAEIGHAKALGKTIFGVWAANEQITISRWAVTAWVSSNCELIRHVNLFHEKLIKYKTREEAAS